MLTMSIDCEEAYMLLKNAEALVLAGKQTGLEVNADKTKYMGISKSECRTMSQYKD